MLLEGHIGPFFPGFHCIFTFKVDFFKGDFKIKAPFTERKNVRDI